jgi:hypothetical protein
LLEAEKAAKKTPTQNQEALPIMTGLFIPANGAINRSMERGAKKEMEYITRILWPVEKKFVERIWDSREDADYKQLYREHLEMFLKEIAFIEKTMKLKYFMVNKDYFMENFRPDK